MKMDKTMALGIWLIITTLVTTNTYLFILNLGKLMHGQYLFILIFGLILIGVWFIVELETAVGLDLLSNEDKS